MSKRMASKVVFFIGLVVFLRYGAGSHGKVKNESLLKEGGGGRRSKEFQNSKTTFIVVLVVLFSGLAIRYPVGRGGLIDLSVGGHLYNA